MNIVKNSSLEYVISKDRYKTGDFNEIITKRLLDDDGDLQAVIKAIMNVNYEELRKLTKGVNLHDLFFMNKVRSMGFFFEDAKPYFGEMLPMIKSINLIMTFLTTDIFHFTNKTVADGNKLRQGFLILEHLIDLGLELNMVRDHSNMTILHSVLLCYQKFEKVEDKDTLDKVMALLLRRGANPDIENIFYGSVREMLEEGDRYSEIDIKEHCPNHREILKLINKYSNKYIHDHDRFIGLASQPLELFLHSDLVNNFTSTNKFTDDDCLFRTTRLPKVNEYVEHIFIFDERDVDNGIPIFSIDGVVEYDDNELASEDGTLGDGTETIYNRYRYITFNVTIGKNQRLMNLYAVNAPILLDKKNDKGIYIMYFDDVIKRGKYYVFHAHTIFESTLKIDDFLIVNFDKLHKVDALSTSAIDKRNNTEMIKHLNPSRIIEDDKFNLDKLSKQKIDYLLEKSQKVIIVSKDGKVLKGIRKNNDQSVIIIPEGIEAIENEAFKENLLIETVVIPSSVKDIKEKAFEKCSNLKNVVIPNSEITIGAEAFKECYQLKSINLSKLTFLSNRAFYNSGLSSVELTIGNKNIPRSCFYDNKALEQVAIPNVFDRIQTGAFQGCSTLKSIHIPSNVIFMGQDVFDGCFNLRITTDHKSKPEGWDETWNSMNRPIAWGYDIESGEEPKYTQDKEEFPIVYTVMMFTMNRKYVFYNTLEKVELQDKVCIDGTDECGIIKKITIRSAQRRLREENNNVRFIKL
jgi:hypothetical protein